jgi:hypothetical protein
MNKQIRFILALVLGLTMLSLPILATAEIIADVLQVTLASKGAGAIVSIEVTCDPAFGAGSHLQINSRLVQRSGSTTSQSSSFFTSIVNCDGNPHRFDLTIITNDKPIKQGSGILEMTVQVFDANFSMNEFTQFAQEVQIEK